MDILLDSECDDLGSELEANSSTELCTGRKKSFPKIETYKLTAHKGFQFTGTKVDYLSGTKGKYDFYLGGTDSCQGKVSNDKMPETNFVIYCEVVVILCLISFLIYYSYSSFYKSVTMFLRNYEIVTKLS